MSVPPRSSRPFSTRLRDFVTYRRRAVRDAARGLVRRAPGWWKHRLWRRLVPYRPGPGPLRLHVGSGTERLEGWVNVDLQPLVEVDVAADVTKTFPYAGVHRIFAEHFLEHLALDDALRFLVRCREALADDGRIRLSTPNLDWVWATQYRLPDSDPGEAADLSPAARPLADLSPADRPLVDLSMRDAALALNRCFYAWGHQFLWNRATLAAALEAAGFVDLAWPAYGESDDPEFRGLERHETWDDAPELPHVLIVEAARGPARPERLAAFRQRAEEQFLRMLPTTHR